MDHFDKPIIEPPRNFTPAKFFKKILPSHNSVQGSHLVVEKSAKMIKHLTIGETYKYNLCLKCHHTMETLCTHEFCIWLIRVGIRQGFNLFRFEIDRM